MYRTVVIVKTLELLPNVYYYESATYRGITQNSVS